MKAELIAVGSELLLGQIANTNAQFLSSRLAELGIDVYFHTAVGDNASRLREALAIARSRADLLILTGGLGPTLDDLTKQTVAEFFERQLAYDEPALKAIEQRYERLGRPMTENNRRQALVIEGARVLANREGMAPGMLFESGRSLCMLLPGPPSELKPMFTEEAMPLLQLRAGDDGVIRSKMLRFFGIGESALETALLPLLEAQSNPTLAPLASDGEAAIRITAKAADEKAAAQAIASAEAAIRQVVGDWIYGEDADTLFFVAARRLREQRLTFAAAESLTAGLFLSEMAAIPGASSYIAGGEIVYTAQAKAERLGVPRSLIDASGTVSAECAQAMAAAVRALYGADIGISLTGVAGPDPLEGHPAGTVFVGVATGDGQVRAIPLNVAGGRQAVRLLAAKHAAHALLVAASRI